MSPTVSVDLLPPLQQRRPAGIEQTKIESGVLVSGRVVKCDGDALSSGGHRKQGP